jgi:hypothetical protein
VEFEGLALGEGSIAVLALEGPLARVNVHVLLETARLREALVADVTHVGLWVIFEGFLKGFEKLKKIKK